MSIDRQVQNAHSAFKKHLGWKRKKCGGNGQVEQNKENSEILRWIEVLQVIPGGEVGNNYV